MRPLIVVVVLGLSSAGCQPDAKPVVSPTEAPTDPADELPFTPIFFAANKAGTTSYLFGTYHVGIDDTRMPQVVWDALANSKTLALESDPASPLAIPTRTDGGSLRADLGPAYWQRFSKAVGSMTAGNLDHLVPLVAAVALEAAPIKNRASLDEAIESRGANLGKPIVGLDTSATDDKIFSQFRCAVLGIELDLDDLELVRTNARVEIAAYSRGDADALLALDREQARALHDRGCPQQGVDTDRAMLVYDRNAAWLPAIEKLHADGGVFIAVGLAHLIGPRSVVELLQQRGFTVTRVPTSP